MSISSHPSKKSTLDISEITLQIELDTGKKGYAGCPHVNLPVMHVLQRKARLHKPLQDLSLARHTKHQCNNNKDLSESIKISWFASGSHYSNSLQPASVWLDHRNPIQPGWTQSLAALACHDNRWPTWWPYVTLVPSVKFLEQIWLKSSSDPSPPRQAAVPAGRRALGDEVGLSQNHRGKHWGANTHTHNLKL